MPYIDDSFDAGQACRSCRDIGDKLDDHIIQNIVDETLEMLGTRKGKPSIAFVSLHMAGLCAAFEEATGIFALPEGFSPANVRASCRLDFTSGEMPDKEDWEPLKRQPNDIVKLLFRRDAGLLRKADVALFFHSNGNMEFDWRHELSDIHYVFFVTSAIQTLTAEEQALIRLIEKYNGPGRLSVVAYGAEMLLAPNAFDAMSERLGWYAGQLGYGAAKLILGCDTLVPFIENSVLERVAELERMSEYQTAKLCFGYICKRVKVLYSQSNQDVSELEKAMEALNERGGHIRDRGKIAANDIYSSITGGLCCSCQKSAREYCSKMNASISKTVQNSTDLKVIVEQIQKYITYSLDRFGKELQKQAEAELIPVRRRLEDQMRMDAGEFFADVPEWALKMFDVPAPQKLGQTKPDKEKMVDIISTALLVSSLPGFIIIGFPFSLGTLLSSQLFKKLAMKNIEGEHREQLLQEIQLACNMASSELQEEIMEKLKAAASDAEKSVVEAYDSFVIRVTEELGKVEEQLRRASNRRENIYKAQTIYLPELGKHFFPESAEG